MGEPLGLFVGENCVHSIFRVPHTSTYVDAFGAEGDADALKTKASRYLRRDDVYEWRTLSERQVWLMISGTRSRERRAARPLALELVKNL